MQWFSNARQPQYHLEGLLKHCRAPTPERWISKFLTDSSGILVRLVPPRSKSHFSNITRQRDDVGLSVGSSSLLPWSPRPGAHPGALHAGGRQSFPQPPAGVNSGLESLSLSLPEQMLHFPSTQTLPCPSARFYSRRSHYKG